MKVNLKLILAVLLISVFTLNSKVSAQSIEDYDFTKAEIEYINEFYGEGYNGLTDEDYDWIKLMNIDENGYRISTAVQDGLISGSTMYHPDTFYETGMKYLASSVSCSDTCHVTTFLNWKSNPNVRSYDVIGARFAGPSLDYVSSTTMTYSGGSTGFSNYQYQTNGFGNSIKLPTSGSNFSITQRFTATGSGRIYCSYQHATSSISLATSKKYNIAAGYGNVFSFYGSAHNVFDGMTGVYVDL